MSALKLKRLVLRNWAMIQAADIQFPEQGLVLVVGDNKASDGFMQSVGSGKTSLGEGLCRALLGCQARSASITSYSTHKKGNTYLQVEAEVDGTPLHVELGYKCAEFEGSGEALRYQFGSHPKVQRATLGATREELSRIVNLTAQVADWTVLVDGDRIKFNQVSQTSAVDLVMQAMNQPAWTDYYDKAKRIVEALKVEHDAAVNTRNQVETTLTSLEGKITEAKTEIINEEADHADRIQKRSKELAKKTKVLEARQKELADVEARRRKIAEEVEDLVQKNSDQCHQIEMRINELNDQLREERKVHSQWVGIEGSADTQWRNARKSLREMEAEPAECPRCGRPWDKEHSQEEIENAKKSVQDAAAAVQRATEKVSASEARSTKLEEAVEAQRNQLKALDSGALKTLSKEDKDLELDLKDINDECHDAEIAITQLKVPPDDTELRLARERLNERLEQQKEQTRRLNELGEDIIDAQEALKAAQYWRVAFGPTGIPNMILEEAIKPLNQVSTALSKRMTGGVLAVTYSTQRKLATGRAKSELIIEVDNKYGSADVKMGSKGECGLTNFFMSETLGQVGLVADRVGFKWYDEVVPHHDGTLCRTIYGYMREQAHRKNMLVFLVDHNPLAENFADHVLVVEKGAGASRVYWR